MRAAAAGLLPAAAIFDAVENTLHLWLTAAPRFGASTIYALSALGAAAKWALLLAFSLAVLRALSRRAD